jgi:hypothetical protein
MTVVELGSSLGGDRFSRPRAADGLGETEAPA